MSKFLGIFSIKKIKNIFNFTVNYCLLQNWKKFFSENALEINDSTCLHFWSAQEISANHTIPHPLPRFGELQKLHESASLW